MLRRLIWLLLTPFKAFLLIFPYMMFVLAFILLRWFISGVDPVKDLPFDNFENFEKKFDRIVSWPLDTAPKPATLPVVDPTTD